MKLTEKQKRFAEEYVKTGNATQSYIDAGYKATTRKVAEANARKLLANYSQITDYIKELNNAIRDQQIADMEEVKAFWTNTLRGKENDMKDRLKASEYIAKTNAAFIDRHEVDGNLNITIEGDVKEWAK